MRHLRPSLGVLIVLATVIIGIETISIACKPQPTPPIAPTPSCPTPPPPTPTYIPIYVCKIPLPPGTPPPQGAGQCPDGKWYLCVGDVGFGQIVPCPVPSSFCWTPNCSSVPPTKAARP